MSVSVATMGLAELASFLVASGSYATVAEAMAALHIVVVEEVGAAAGTALVVSGGPASTAIGTVGETALELAARAQLGAAGTGVRTASIGLLKGETATGAAALLGIDLGVVAAAAAPVLGVSLGASLYEKNPELWTKISQKLLPFCYPGTTKIPTWAEISDDAWEASIAKRVIDSLKELFDEEGIGVSESTYYDNFPSSIPITPPVKIYGSGTYQFNKDTITVETNGFVVFAGRAGDNDVKIGFFADTPNVGRWRWGKGAWYSVTGSLYNGYYCAYNWATGSSTLVDGSMVTRGVGRYPRLQDIIDAILGGTATPIGGYPEGTSRWEGENAPEIPESKPAVIGIDSTTGQPITQPMVPISPPYPPVTVPKPVEDPEPETIPFPWPEPSTEPHTRPWPTEMPWPLPVEQPPWWPIEIPYPGTYPAPQPSPDPSEQPDPYTITDPWKQIQPWILPLPLPWELPAPEPKPAPDPKRDPTLPFPIAPPTTLDPPPGSIFDPLPPIGISPWPSMPGTPPPFAQNVGLVTVYHPTPEQLYDFERWLWVTLSQASVETVWNNPFDGVITLFELYCTPTDIGNRNIHSGFLDSGVNSAVISRYTEIDCGTIGIPEYYGNYFDYSPYSKAHIYLPFIGIQELNVDDIVGHTVNVTYRIDEYNGSCIAMITVAKVTEVNGESVEYSNTMYQFSGNCSVELPISGGSQAQIKAGLMMADATRQAAMVSAGAQLIGGIGSLLGGHIGGALSGLGGAIATKEYGEVSALGHMLSGKSTVQKSGSFGSSHGALGIKVPFIVVTRPKQIQVPNYNELYGFPAHKMVYINECTGFLRCREVHVVSATANDDEKSMIENLLKTGVYVTE